MYNAILCDKTRDAANQDSDAGIVGHSDHKDEIHQAVIQINEKTT
jgi:hypothetical protein